MTKHIDFPLWIYEEMEKRDWKPADLARHADIDPAALSNILNMKRGVGQKVATAIAEAFGYTPEVVFREAGLLPEKSKDNARLEIWRKLLLELSEENNEELLEIARLKLARQSSQKQTVPPVVFQSDDKER